MPKKAPMNNSCPHDSPLNRGAADIRLEIDQAVRTDTASPSASPKAVHTANVRRKSRISRLGD